MSRALRHMPVSHFMTLAGWGFMAGLVMALIFTDRIIPSLFTEVTGRTGSELILSGHLPGSVGDKNPAVTTLLEHNK